MPAEKLQELKLSKRPFAEDVFGEDVGDLLDGHHASIGRCAIVIFGGTYYTVCTMPQLLNDFESLVDNKVLVEDLVDGTAVCRHECTSQEDIVRKRSPEEGEGVGRDFQEFPGI